MPFSLTWLPGVLAGAGLKVAEVPGWPNRGHGDVGTIEGVMCHHTAGSRSGNMPSLKVITEGRPGLEGPLSQLGLGRDGTFFVVAAGKASHAGGGDWQGIRTGNRSFIGIEAENTGIKDPSDPRFDPWPEAQIDAYQRGVAAILKRIGKPAGMACAHREYALPSGRKPDMHTIDMDGFRRNVGAIMTGSVPAPALIPARDPEGRPTLRRGGANNPAFLVREVQRKIGLAPDLITGNFGPMTEAAMRRFQRARGLNPDGIVGPKTWIALDEA